MAPLPGLPELWWFVARERPSRVGSSDITGWSGMGLETRTTGGSAQRGRAHAVSDLLSVLMLALLTACAPSISDRVPLELVHRESVSEDAGERVESLIFVTSAGDSVTAYLRLPILPPADGLAGVVLVAGRETGRQAAQVVPGPLEAAVLSVEYPAVLPERLTLGSMLTDLPDIRESALTVPGILVSAAEFLAAEPEVDRTRIALVGVSFGVPFAAAAGSDAIFRAVALHYGGGDLDLLLRTNLPVENGFLRRAAARFLSFYMRPLEPFRQMDGLGQKPLLLISGTGDIRVPRASAIGLAERASGPVRHIWLHHDHLMPGDTAIMRELADSTISHFDFLAPGRR